MRLARKRIDPLRIWIWSDQSHILRPTRARIACEHVPEIAHKRNQVEKIAARGRLFRYRLDGRAPLDRMQVRSVLLDRGSCA